MSRVPAEKRLQRLLVMIPWIMQHDGPLVEEVCTRFNTSEDELANDLELLFLCGLYPFTPDTLIEADIVDGRVWIRSAEQFHRPPRFTADEALVLMASASVVADLAGNEDNATLRSALGKLSSVLGLVDDETVEIELSKATPQILEAVKNSVESKRVLEIDYYSYGRDAWSRRLIEPYLVFNADGNWYVQARAREVDEIRNFRIDRMRNVRLTDEIFSPPTERPPARVYQARETDPIVELELDNEVEWVLEQFPVENVKKLRSGNTRVTMRVSEKLWFKRLLLRLGPHAKMVKGDLEVGPTARQILMRYEGSH